MKNCRELSVTLEYKCFYVQVSCLFWFCFFLWMLLPEKIWQASEDIPSRSASVCCWPEKHTHVNTYTVTCERGVSSPCLSPAAGTAARCPALLEQQKTTGFVFDLTPTIHHLKSKKQKQKKKKKDLSCQLLGKHRLLWREREREKRQK